MSKEKTQSLTRKGSILAYSLIIIATMLAIAGSLSVVTVLEKKGASGTEFSMQSLQTADGGVQLALKKINAEISKTSPGNISNAIPECVDSSFSATGPVESNYKIEFFEDGNSTPLPCGASVTQIDSIRSIGTYRNTVRAVQVAVAATGDNNRFYSSNTTNLAATASIAPALSMTKSFVDGNVTIAANGSFGKSPYNSTQNFYIYVDGVQKTKTSQTVAYGDGYLGTFSFSSITQVALTAGTHTIEIRYDSSASLTSNGLHLTTW